MQTSRTDADVDHPPRHVGTWVELFVVFVVIALLLALIFPAVQQAREASRRTQCKNNLKQIGLALHNYFDTFNSFPSGSTIGREGTPSLWSWQAYILPYMDEAPLYNVLNLKLGVLDPINRKSVGRRVSQYLCPTDASTVSAFNETEGIYDGPWGLTNYLGVSGRDAVYTESDGFVPASACSAIATSVVEGEPTGLSLQSGLFFADSHVTINEILDGTANTIAVGERGIPLNGQRGWWTGPGVAGACPPGWTDVVLATQDPYGFSGFRRATQASDPLSAFHWWSYHDGGAQFMLADGSVRHLAYGISPDLFRAISTRSNMEVVGEF